jgi:hypothetical protein
MSVEQEVWEGVLRVSDAAVFLVAEAVSVKQVRLSDAYSDPVLHLSRQKPGRLRQVMEDWRVMLEEPMDFLSYLNSCLPAFSARLPFHPISFQCASGTR